MDSLSASKLNVQLYRSIKYTAGGGSLICHDSYSEHEYDKWYDIVPSSIQTSLRWDIFH